MSAHDEGSDLGSPLTRRRRKEVAKEQIGLFEPEP